MLFPNPGRQILGPTELTICKPKAPVARDISFWKETKLNLTDLTVEHYHKLALHLAITPDPSDLLLSDMLTPLEKSRLNELTEDNFKRLKPYFEKIPAISRSPMEVCSQLSSFVSV